MTIDAIFERYEVPVALQQQAFARAGRALALHDAWVGPEVSWSVIVKALLFASLGDEAQSAHIRKKVGLDKYAATLIARGGVQYAKKKDVALELHQMVYMYCLYCADLPVQKTYGDTWSRIIETIQSNCIDVPAVLESCSPAAAHTLRQLEIYHYKNPSV